MTIYSLVKMTRSSWRSCLKLVTFDATNTLLNFRVPPWRHYNDVVRDYNFEADEDLIKRQLKSTFKCMHKKYPNFGKDSIGWEKWWCQVVHSTLQNVIPSNAPFDAIADKLIGDFKTAKCWCVAEGAEQLLDQLILHHNLEVGVISNFDPRLIDILKSVCLYDKLKFVITSYDVGYAKPDKKIFDLARDMCGSRTKPQECLHIGDDLKKDYLGAVMAEWHGIIVTKQPLEKPPAQGHVFTSLVQLGKAIENKTLIL